MKRIFALLFFMTVSFVNLCSASELSWQLEELKRQGFVVRMGELTGAGGKLSLSRVQGFIHPEGIIKKTACSAISVRSTSDPKDPKISDVTKIKIGVNEVSAQELVGFFTAE